MHCRNKGFLLVELNLALIFIINNDEPAVCRRGATAAAGLAAYTV